MAIRLRVEGERAFFARPEFRHDLISYDLITPHAARGILDAIYWRPGMIWVIDAIRVLHPIRRECVEEDGRRILLLRNVGYVIHAHFELASGEPDAASGRHAAMFRRAARATPTAYLGRAGCDARVTLFESHEPDAPFAGTPGVVDHGWLLHGIAFADDRRPRYFRAEAVGGLVRVPTTDSPLLFG